MEKRTTPLPPSPPPSSARWNQRTFLQEADELDEGEGDMENENENDEASSSSLRTHLMKAQILDTQLETEEETGMAELLTEDKDNQIDGTAVLNEMDDAIIRLRKWQLDREINKLEVELQMQQAWEVREAKNVETAAKTSIDTVDSEGEYKQRRSASKKSLKSIEALIRTKTSPDRRIDLSILNEQDRILANESMRNMEVTEQVKHELNEAACRRRLDEVQYGGEGLEADVSSLTTQLLNFSSELDSLLCQSESLEISIERKEEKSSYYNSYK